MVSTWRSKSNEATLEAIINSLDEMKSQSSNFSVPINENGQKFGTGGKGSPTGAVGGSGGNQFFPATRSKITSYDINQVDQTILDRLNITSRLMVVVGDDPSNLNIKWIQFAKSDGQPIWLMPEAGKTIHLLPFGNIDIGAQVDVADTQIVELIYNTESDVTADGGFTIVGLGSGGGGLNFPILYPEDDLGTVGGANITPDLSGSDAHFKQVTINGDIGIATPTNPPAANRFFEWWLQITQDAVGGRSISTVSAPIKNSGNLDTLLDKNPNAVTIFHFTTGDGGTSYHAELVDLTSGGAGGEFFGPMTATHNYGNQDITNLKTLFFDDAGNSIIADPIGMLFTTAATDQFDWTVGGSNKMSLETLTLNLKVDLDLNPTSLLAHSLSGFDFLQLQNDAGASYGTITPDQSASPGMLLTMNSNQDLIIAGSAGERFRFLPDTSPRMQMTGGLLPVFSIETTVGDVFQIVLDEVSNLASVNTTNTMELKSGGNDKLFIKNTDVELWTDLDMNTFDIFDVDLHTFAPGGASLLATDVGYTSPTGGGLHANILNNQKFEITEELVVKMSLDLTANIAYFNDMILTVQEVSSGDVVQILASAGLASISSTQDLRVNGVMDVGSGGVTMVGTQYIANLDQLGFRNLGNFIEDDANGMRLSIIPAKDFTFTDGVTEMAVLDVDALRLNNMSIQMDSQASPGTTGFANVGYIFMDSGNSHHLSIIRNGGVIDLESTGGSLTPWTSDIDADGFDLQDLSNIEFRTSTGAPTAGTQAIWADVNGIIFNVPTGDDYSWNVQGTEQAFLSATQFSSSVVGKNLGSAGIPWEKFSVKDIEIETGGTLTTTKNNIVSDSFGMVFGVPDADFFTFRMNGNPILIIDEDEIRFGVSGKAHRINATTTALTLTAENSSDSVNFFNGTSAPNESYKIENFRSTWRTTTTDSQAYDLQIIQNNDTPVDFRTIGNIYFIAENSISVDTRYGIISCSSQDITSTTEDGLLQLGVISAGTLISGMDIEGGTAVAAGARIGFYGHATTALQTGVAVSAAGIHAALVNLGLIT